MAVASGVAAPRTRSGKRGRASVLRASPKSVSPASTWMSRFITWKPRTLEPPSA
jgi:hypothetical protein